MVGAIRRFLSLAAVLALAACSSAHSPPVVQNAPPAVQDNSCARGEAKAVKFQALQRHPEQFADQCVRTELFTDGVDVAENAALLHAKLPKGVSPLVFHFVDPVRQWPRTPSFVSVVARVRRDGLYVCDIRLVPTAMD